MQQNSSSSTSLLFPFEHFAPETVRCRAVSHFEGLCPVKVIKAQAAEFLQGKRDRVMGAGHSQGSYKKGQQKPDLTLKKGSYRV